MHYVFMKYINRELYGIAGLEEASNSRILFNSGVSLSVQANRTAYCTPRKTLEKLSDYKSFEVAVYDKDQQFLSVPELEEYEESEVTCVYVPSAIIEELFLRLEKEEGGVLDLGSRILERV